MITLWQSWTSTVLGFIPYVGLEFDVYKSTQNPSLRKACGHKDFVLLQEGMIALWRGWVLSVLVIISFVDPKFSVHVQTQISLLRKVCSQKTLLLLQEGMIALWRGWVPSVLGVIPYVGLNFSVYETLKDMVLKTYGELRHPALVVLHYFVLHYWKLVAWASTLVCVRLSRTWSSKHMVSSVT